MKVVYMAHRLGAGPEREENRRIAAEWAAWLCEAYDVAVVADWIVLSGIWPETMREKGLAIDFALIARCDEVWLVGDRVSAGMALEAAEARRLGKPVVDLVEAFGGLRNPPVAELAR